MDLASDSCSCLKVLNTAWNFTNRKLEYVCRIKKNIYSVICIVPHVTGFVHVCHVHSSIRHKYCPMYVTCIIPLSHILSRYITSIVLSHACHMHCPMCVTPLSRVRHVHIQCTSRVLFTCIIPYVSFVLSYILFHIRQMYCHMHIFVIVTSPIMQGFIINHN